MTVTAGVSRRVRETAETARWKLKRGHARLRGSGVNLGDRERSLQVRVLPSAAAQSPLTIDLDIIAPALTASKPRVSFVQIGAFDGQANDPVHDLVVGSGWRGVLVEPQPLAFERLRETYAGVDGLVFLNAAIAPQRGTRPFYYVAGEEPDDPWWRGQIASFDRAHLMKHINDDERLAARVVSRDVETLTLSDALARAPEPPDVLQIDAEGHDGQIVASLDLTGHLPTVIRFEHRHLSLREHEAALAHLQRGGYRFAVNEDDTIAMQHERGRGMLATA